MRFVRHRVAQAPGDRIVAAAAAGNALFTWGDRVVRWDLVSGRHTSLARGAFLEGGCLFDVDGDGELDIVLNEGPERAALVWIHLPSGTRHVIDTGVLSADMLAVTLHGHRGVLVVHRGGQVRMYEAPSDPRQPWLMREIYSFYSPSRQGGLALADVDGNGIPDILCGNYWIQSPVDAGLPWRLFAIELWNELPASAMLRLVMTDRLFAAEREMAVARFSWFEKPVDPKQRWIEHPVAMLNRPNSLDTADFDGDGQLEILVAERGGAGRLIVFKGTTQHILAEGPPIVYARALAGAILTVSHEAISVWTQGS